MRELSEFPADSIRRRRYDWRLLLDGRIRELEQDIDFDCRPASLVTTVKQNARKRELEVLVRSYAREEDQRDVVVVQALGKRA